MGQHHTLGLTGAAAGGDHEGVAVLDGATVGESLPAVTVGDVGGCETSDEGVGGRLWKPGIEGEGGVAGVPDSLQCLHERRRTHRRDQHEVAHTSTVTVRADLPSPHNSSPGDRACNALGVTDPAATTIRPAADWQSAGDYHDIRYEIAEGIAKITINRPEVRNAFRPQTLFELSDAFDHARDNPEVGVIILTGQGDMAFCSGGDQRIRGNDGYIGSDEVAQRGIGRLNVLDLQIQIRRTPKPVVAMVAGYAIGGGHVLHVVCDLSIAADNARFGQTGPKVGSFDGGYGSGLLAANIGQKKAREIWFLCRQYDAAQALDMGLVNAVVPLAELEEETVQWCREMLTMSPLALRMVKASMNAADDGLAGIQQLAGDATLLFYMTEEAQEGRDAYKNKRRPEFERFPRRP